MNFAAASRSFMYCEIGNSVKLCISIVFSLAES
jgi:hypothetical protein